MNYSFNNFLVTCNIFIFPSFSYKQQSSFMVIWCRLPSKCLVDQKKLVISGCPMTEFTLILWCYIFPRIYLLLCLEKIRVCSDKKLYPRSQTDLVKLYYISIVFEIGEKNLKGLDASLIFFDTNSMFMIFLCIFGGRRNNFILGRA